jgi:hypothetical protein
MTTESKAGCATRLATMLVLASVVFAGVGAPAAHAQTKPKVSGSVTVSAAASLT